jgi:hypothetical protein
MGVDAVKGQLADVVIKPGRSLNLQSNRCRQPSLLLYASPVLWNARGLRDTGVCLHQAFHL